MDTARSGPTFDAIKDTITDADLVFRLERDGVNEFVVVPRTLLSLVIAWARRGISVHEYFYGKKTRRLYFDYDCKYLTHSDEVAAGLQEGMGRFADYLRQEFDTRVIVWDASNDKKFSKHVVCLDVGCKRISDLKSVVKQVLRRAKAMLPTDKFDMMYSNSTFRMGFSTKDGEQRYLVVDTSISDDPYTSAVDAGQSAADLVTAGGSTRSAAASSPPAVSRSILVAGSAASGLASTADSADPVSTRRPLLAAATDYEWVLVQADTRDVLRDPDISDEPVSVFTASSGDLTRAVNVVEARYPTMRIDTKRQASRGGYRVNSSGSSWYCYVCDKTHDSDNAIMFPKEDCVIFYCFASNRTGGRKSEVLRYV